MHPEKKKSIPTIFLELLLDGFVRLTHYRSIESKTRLSQAIILMLSALSFNADASSIYYWAAYYPSHPAGLEPKKFGDHKAACDSLRKNIYYYQKREYDKSTSNQYYCFIRDVINNNREWIGKTTGTARSCPLGHSADYNCNTVKPTCAYGAFDPNSNQCVATSDKGQPPQSCEPDPLTGNPINFLTGNKFHQEIYYQSAQAGGTVFKRTYNSADAVWRHSYSDRLIFNSDHILLTLADGKELRYSLQGSPLDGAAARFGELHAVAGGWQYATKAFNTYQFDSSGRLTQVREGSGHAHKLSYVSSATSTQVFITDEFDNRIDFKQSASGNLFAFNAPNITTSFLHSNGQLIKATKITNGLQSIRDYHYEDTRNVLLLTGITDERGVRYATWRYDDLGRAISSEHAGRVDKVSISYDSNTSTTITNELGKKAIYRFAVIDGSKRITAIEGQPSANCPNSNSSFTYDERGLLKTKTDNKGHLTTYDYNARGLEISRTEASGTPQARTVTTEWHPTLYLPVTITEPGRVLRFEYDAQGNQLSQTISER